MGKIEKCAKLKNVYIPHFPITPIAFRVIFHVVINQ